MSWYLASGDHHLPWLWLLRPGSTVHEVKDSAQKHQGKGTVYSHLEKVTGLQERVFPEVSARET